MATSGHPISSSCRLPAMSSRARITVASLLMGLAVLAGSCVTTTNAQVELPVTFYLQPCQIPEEVVPIPLSGFEPLGVGVGLPKVEVEPVKVTVDNRLDCTLGVFPTANLLRPPKIAFAAPRKVGSIPLRALAPASSPKLTIQVLPDKAEYIIVDNAAWRGVALTGPLSIVVVKSCKSPHGTPGLLLEVTNGSKLKETICAEADGSPP